MLFHLYIGERGESEMSPDSVPVSPGEPDPLPQLKRPTGVADIREDSNVGPDSADPGTSTIDNVSFRWYTKEFVHPLIISVHLASSDNLQEAYVDFGNKEANTSIRGNSFLLVVVSLFFFGTYILLHQISPLMILTRKA